MTEPHGDARTREEVIQQALWIALVMTLAFTLLLLFFGYLLLSEVLMFWIGAWWFELLRKLVHWDQETRDTIRPAVPKSDWNRFTRPPVQGLRKPPPPPAPPPKR